MSISISMNLGSMRQISVVPRDTSGQLVTGITPVYSSNNPAVAIATPTGLIVPVSVGVASISVSAGGLTDTIIVAVGSPVNDITVIVPPITAYNTPVTATATVHDRTGGVLTGLALSWSTNADPDVAVVDSAGRVTAFADGTFDVICTTNGISGEAVVTVATVVDTVPATVVVSPATPSIVELGTQQFTAVVKNAAGQTISGAVVTWSSLDTGVATINGSGLATGVAIGSATIRATSGTVHGDAALTVALDTTPASVVVAPSTATLAPAATQQFTATVKNANNTTIPGAVVTWSSLSTGVATVNSSGLATGVADGSATIRATSGTVHGDATLTVSTVGSTIVHDSVTRADSTTTPGSTESPVLAWTTMNGSTWGVLGGGLYNVTPTTNSGIWVESGVSDCSVVLTIGSVSGNPQIGVVFRRTDDSNFIVAFFAGTSVFFRKIVAGVASPLATAVPVTLVAGDTFKITGLDDQLHVYHNTTDLFGAVTDSFNQGATKHGVYSFDVDTYTTVDVDITVP